MSVLEALGQSPLNSAITTGLSKFTSIFRNRVSNAYADDPGRYPRGYVKSRGILIEKDKIAKKEFDKGYFFQFNPSEIQDVKNTLYEVRPYAGMAYNDYIWSNGGERIISFQLFLDNTPQSKTEQFRPEAINNTALANTLQAEGTKNPSSFQWMQNGAYSNTRVSERGVLPEVERLQSFLYPAPIGDEKTPLFAEGGIVTTTQFRPPSVLVFALGPLYLEGVLRSAPVTYQLFDSDLTPIRASISIEFSVFEFESINKVEVPLR